MPLIARLLYYDEPKDIAGKEGGKGFAYLKQNDPNWLLRTV